jgi:glycyl-tRNA synthetase
MELEFFCHPEQATEWYGFWCASRLEWWKTIGLASENLRVRQQSKDELAHYAKDGAGTSDIEYRFPFTDPEFGEIEGVAHRADFDLATHQQHSKTRLEYFDADRGELLANGGRRGERYLPHVIEPSAGLDRGVLALLCEAFTEDPSRPSPELLKLHPRLAPIKAAVLPLVNKDGMPERPAVSRPRATSTRSRRQGDRGVTGGRTKPAPFCITVDGQTEDQTVTARDRDTGQQERIALDRVVAYLTDKLGCSAQGSVRRWRCASPGSCLMSVALLHLEPDRAA